MFLNVKSVFCPGEKSQFRTEKGRKDSFCRNLLPGGYVSLFYFDLLHSRSLLWRCRHQISVTGSQEMMFLGALWFFLCRQSDGGVFIACMCACVTCGWALLPLLTRSWAGDFDILLPSSSWSVWPEGEKAVAWWPFHQGNDAEPFSHAAWQPCCCVTLVWWKWMKEKRNCQLQGGSCLSCVRCSCDTRPVLTVFSGA